MESLELKQVKRVYKKKIKEPKHFFIFYKNSQFQKNYMMATFTTEEIALNNKKIWEGNKKICFLKTQEQLNAFIES